MASPKQQSIPITDRSYGIIPLRFFPSSPSNAPKDKAENSKPTTKNTQLLLIPQKTLLGPGTEFWCFPKGHPEDGDKDVIETAMRELFEETGLVISREDIVSLVGYVHISIPSSLSEKKEYVLI
jgi:bis(5'-nucleosidyl)-tetraphosphatase